MLQTFVPRIATVAGAAIALVALLAVGSAPALAAGPNAFTLHLDCDNGQSFDITVNDGHAVAALIDGSRGVAVLKNGNGTVVPAFGSNGPLNGTLATCDTGIPGFTAVVLFTPASFR